MPDPTPVPTVIKIANGNPGKKRLSKKEPKPTKAISQEAPKWLSREAKAMWRKLVPEFQAMGLLASIDANTFATYCESFTTYIRLTEELLAEGEVIRGHNRSGHAYVLANPKSNMRMQAYERFRKAGALIGDSPASRARLGRLLDDDTDELDEVLHNRPGRRRVS
jgi:P27 family predicted phage terminase small subunit